MAKDNVRTNEQTRQESEGREGREMSRGGQGGTAVQRRGGYDPLGFSLLPSEFLFANPFSIMRRLTEEMDRALAPSPSGRGNATPAAWVSAVEVTERDGKYVIRAELPGLRPDDVRIEATEDAIILEGERRETREENENGMQRTEIRYGRFFRSIPLPDGARVDQANARFDNGVLEITIPLPEQQSRRRQIPVQGSSQTGSSQTSGSQTTGSQTTGSQTGGSQTGGSQTSR